MSRLAGDGWVTRQKVGRNSFYALTPVALAELEAGARRIYAARHPQDPCSWRVTFGGGLPKPEQARLRAALRRRGAADLGAHVYLLPAGEDPRDASRAIALRADPLPDAEARRLVERAFDLAALGQDYARFHRRFRARAGEVLARAGSWSASTRWPCASWSSTASEELCCATR